MADIHPIIDEHNVKQRYPTRLQFLAKAWQQKYEGALDHSQRLQNLWISGYYNKGYARWHLVNLINRGVSAGVSYLVEGNPKITIEPIAPNLRYFAYTMKLISNFLLDKYDFAENVLIPGATASYFGAGIARTFFEYNRRVTVEDEKGKISKIKAGTPKVVIIEPCDYIGDPSAKRRCDFAFEGDMYRLPTKYAKDLFARKDKFGHEIADFIKPDCNLITKYSNEELIAKDGYDFNKLALDDYTTFIDLYNFKDRVIETIMPMGQKALIVKSIDWKYPASPYDYLGYRYPTNVPVPIPPAWDLYDLDVTANIMGKAARQAAETQRTIIAAEPGSKEAAEAVKKGKHLDVMLVKGMENVKQFTFSGVNAENYQWMNWVEDQFNKAGTTSSDIMSGKGPSSPTLGQDQLIYANATRMVNNYYNRFHSWMTNILKKFVWAVMEEPSSYVEILDTVKLPGIGEYEYPVVFSKADKVADFYNLVLKVVPYSTQRMTPEMKYQRLFQMMTTWTLPTLQLRAMQGSSIDLSMVDKLLADYAGMDEFPQWYRSVLPKEAPEVDVLMKTTNGQMNDSAGSLDVSREAQSGQYDLLNGMGSERQPPQTKG